MDKMEICIHNQVQVFLCLGRNNTEYSTVIYSVQSTTVPIIGGAVIRLPPIQCSTGFMHFGSLSLL